MDQIRAEVDRTDRFLEIEWNMAESAFRRTGFRVCVATSSGYGFVVVTANFLCQRDSRDSRGAALLV
jgi:hypothetical protein